MTQEFNPLQKYYRAPGVNVRLPSMGRFQSPDNVRFTATGDIPVLPMRAADEMLLKSPDALMSGMAIENLIRSCVPDIKDPTQLPTPDVDALLLAIRAATYGHSMTVEAECPACSTENAYDFDILAILDTVTELDQEYAVRLNDEVVVYLRPFNFRNSTVATTTVFQETRRLRLVEDDPSFTDEQRQTIINSSYKALNDMNVQMLAECVDKVVVPEGEVTDRKMIGDFVHNIERGWVATLEAKLKLINEAGVNKRHSIACSKCNHEWETVVEFDPANFFGQSS